MGEDTEEILVQVYDESGQYGVYDWCSTNHPEWKWSPCRDCADETPTWITSSHLLCAVCFSVKPS